MSHLFSIQTNSHLISSHHSCASVLESHRSALYNFDSSLGALWLHQSTFYSLWLASVRGSPLPHPGSPRDRRGVTLPTPSNQSRHRRDSPSCLQEADNKPFVFSFYKRKFCGGLPGRSDEADTQTQPTSVPFSFSDTGIHTRI